MILYFSILIGYSVAWFSNDEFRELVGFSVKLSITDELKESLHHFIMISIALFYFVDTFMICCAI